MNNPISPSRQRSGQVAAGLLLVAAGIYFLLRELGYFFPSWLMSWPVILILVGIFTWTISGFRGWFWLILTGIGVIFLLNRIYPEARLIGFAWPAFIMLIGLWIMLGRRLSAQFWDADNWIPVEKFDIPPRSSTFNDSWDSVPTSDEQPERLDTVAVLGGSRRLVQSKNFLGGEVVSFMGGAEINLLKADIRGRVELEVVAVLGGIKLLLPPHWEVVSEMTSVLGGIEDKRMIAPQVARSGKVLLIKGTAVLGGIEIHSFD